MIDIHTHILAGVDDGCENIEQSVSMLLDAENMGITDIILTPHFREEFTNTPELLRKKFNELNDIKTAKGINVNLYLGEEIFVTDDLRKQMKENLVLTLNNTNNVLLEFDYDEYNDIAQTVFEISNFGYKGIVAHVERYSYMDIDSIAEIKCIGGIIQVNAGSITGFGTNKQTKLIKKLLKYDLIDVIASDVHLNRNNEMKKAYEFIEKEYGKERAERLFVSNPKSLLK